MRARMPRIAAVSLRRTLSLCPAPALATLAAAVVAVLATAAGLVAPLDRGLSDAWFGLSSVEPSGCIVLVDLTRAAAEGGDALGLPRADLARLLDRIGDAGAGRILVDLTLAGETTAAGDGALEAVLARLGPDRVALTASAMASTAAGGVTHWRRPNILGRFARHAASVASDLAYDRDGRLRRSGIASADLAPMTPVGDWLARRGASPAEPRALDFGIDVRSVPTLDALDVMRGQVDRGRLSGRAVVVANFADALGGEIRVPRFGGLRRPEVDLLSAETSLRGRPLHRLDAPAELLGVALLAALAALWTSRLGAGLGLAATLGGGLSLLGISAWCQCGPGLIVPAASPLSALALGYGMGQIGTHPALSRVRDALGGLIGRADLRIARVLDETGEALVTFASDGRILSMNEAARRLFACSPSPDGASISDLVGEGAGALMAATEASRPGHVEATIERGTAGPRHLDLRVNAMRADAGEWIGIATVRDVTEHRAQLDALRRMATQDPLTGLPNRLGFERAVAEGCEGCGASSGGMAVLMCDLDGFKAVNDTLGHLAGDALLREIGGRLRAGLTADAVVARLGGDEFGLVLRGPGLDAAAAAATAEGLVAAVAAPIGIDGHPVTVGVSIGIALYPSSGRDGDALVKAADAAMYRAKRARTGFAFGLDLAA